MVHMQSQNVIFQLFVGLMPLVYVYCVAPHNAIKIYDFVIKFSGVSDLRGAKSPFPLSLLVIVTTVASAAYD